MNQAKFLLLISAMLLLVGCTDNINSIAREYRNATNEGIDALMMVTDDRSAARLQVRVFKPMGDRFKDIDNRLKIVENNRSKKDMIKEVFESDGFHLYVTELQINRQRMGLEVTRLRFVLNQYAKEERDRLDAAGEFDAPVDLVKVCPSLFDLVVTDTTLGPLRDQLLKPKLLAATKPFADWKIEGYSEMLKQFNAKRATFGGKAIDFDLLR